MKGELFALLPVFSVAYGVDVQLEAETARALVNVRRRRFDVATAQALAS
jgi:hypothetical protein